MAEENHPLQSLGFEIMLQQTQVVTATPYFKKFIQEFPTVKSLSKATPDQVLKLWSGLGYYARARNLHKAAKLICSNHEGKIPSSINELVELPGIGKIYCGGYSVLGFQEESSYFGW
ncbi:MAG: hypothetical protein CM1200mP12_09420 [Gammaproteobacteria bacterium]|nr:MAG: hypothetical protein CM1200mP12_09420 [Gammaproteobacteria bacterium]